MTFRLTRFEPGYAPAVVGWVRTERELLWLAPSTEGPLTVEKVIGWKKEDGAAFVLLRHGEACAVGYGELNPMRAEPDHLWLGHLIVRPEDRGRGLGRLMVHALLREAFGSVTTRRVSLIVFPDNGVAIRCYQRVGFRRVGEECHQFDKSGLKRKLLRLEIGRADWQASQGPAETACGSAFSARRV